MAPSRKQNPDEASGRAKPVRGTASAKAASEKAGPGRATSGTAAHKKTAHKEGAARKAAPKSAAAPQRAVRTRAATEKPAAAPKAAGPKPRKRASAAPETEAAPPAPPTPAVLPARPAHSAGAAAPAARPAFPYSATVVSPALPPAPPRPVPVPRPAPVLPSAGSRAPTAGTQTPTTAAPAARVIPPLPDDADDPEPYEPEAGGREGLLESDAGNAAEDEREEGAGEPAGGGAWGAGPGSARPSSATEEAARVLEAVRRGERHVSSLDALNDAQLTALTQSQGWRPRPGERRNEIFTRLLQGRAPPEAPVSVFVEGLLELHPDGYGFLRRPQQNYAQHPLDVYVAAGLVRRVGLKAGHWVSGQAHRARPQEPTLALHEIEEVNHEDPARLAAIVPFEKLTVVYPDTRYVLEVNPEDIEMRLMDLFCPLGRGQRGLIVAPPRSGKTVILQKIADAVAHNSPNADIVVLLVDERPEEVTNMRRSVRGEVIASTFDKPVANHVRVAELTIEKVKRMVELGRHVVLLLDSITRLGRAYNNLAPSSGRILSGGMDAGALTKPKLFFASARNVEDGGSLTILATALVDTGSRLDTLVFEEFKGSGNMELALDRDLANQRIWPAINIPASGTRNEDLLLHPEELRRITRLRRALSDHAPVDAMVLLKDLMKQHATNAELVMSIE